MSCNNKRSLLHLGRHSALSWLTTLHDQSSYYDAIHHSKRHYSWADACQPVLELTYGVFGSMMQVVGQHQQSQQVHSLTAPFSLLLIHVHQLSGGDISEGAHCQRHQPEVVLRILYQHLSASGFLSGLVK